MVTTVKISGLPTLTVAEDDDIIVINDVTDDTTKQITKGDLYRSLQENIEDQLANGVRSITPSFHDTYDLGSSVKNWRDVYVSGTLYAENIVSQTIEGAGIGAGVDSAGIINLLAINGVNSIVPESDGQYDLGSPSRKWRDLYLSGQTIYLGDFKTISEDSSTFKFNASIRSTGDIVAGKFYGDGSGLFGVDATDGTSVSQLAVYKRSSTVPTTPGTQEGESDGYFNFTTRRLVPPTGWTQYIPSGSASDIVYTSVASASIQGVNGTDSDLVWSTPEVAFDTTNITDGRSTYQVIVYQRDSNQPDTPTADGSFDFGANILTPPAGWYKTIREATEAVTYPNTRKIWGSEFLFNIVGDTGIDSVAPDSWTTPVEVFGPGRDGISSFAFQIYKRSAELPAKPTGGSYDFTNNLVNAPSGWVDSVPDYDGTPLYASSTLASITGPTGIDNTLEWTDPKLYLTVPADGNTLAQVSIYKRSATSLNTAPSGGQFNFTTRILTPPDTWSVNVPDGTDQVFVSTAVASNLDAVDVGGDIVDQTLQWSRPDPTSAGTNGVSGVSTFQALIFKRSPTELTQAPQGGYFDFGENFLQPPDDWYRSIADANAVGGQFDDLYVSSNQFRITGDTGIDSGLDNWTLPGLNGNVSFDGLSTYSFPVFKRSASQPAKPGTEPGDSSGYYSFTDNQAVPPTGWSVIEPPLDGSPLYVSRTVATTSGPTGVDSSLSWTTPSLLVSVPTDGNTVAQISVYKRSETELTTAPTGGSFNFATKVITPPSGWSLAPPSTESPGTEILYVSTAVAVDEFSAGGTDNTLAWSIPDVTVAGQNGINAVSTFQASIYKRSATDITDDEVTGGTFNFGTNVLQAPLGWSATFPETGTDPVYVCNYQFRITGDTGEEEAGTWTGPALYTQNGTDGLSTYFASIFLRSVSAPSTPTGGTYSFTDNEFTVLPSGGWLDSVPETDGNPLYVSNTIASTVGPTGEDDSLTWTPPKKIAENGTDGNSYAQISVYRRSATALNTKPTGGSFDFSTRTIAPPTDWFVNIPTGNDQLYVSSAVAVDTLSLGGVDDTLNWSTPDQATAGTDGQDGVSTWQAIIFKRSATDISDDQVTGGTFNFGTNVFVPPEGGWSSSVPTTGTDEIYFCTYQFRIIGDTGEEEAGTWVGPALLSEKGPEGADGLSTYKGTVFTRSATEPDTPTGNYSFTDNEFQDLTAGWSEAIPATDGNPAWSSTATAKIQGITGVDTNVTFSPPQKVLVDGAEGVGVTGPRSAAGYIYYQSSTTDKPDNPSAANVAYNFATGQLSGGVIGTTATKWNQLSPVNESGGSYWYAAYTVVEDEFGGTYTVTFSSTYAWTRFTGLVTFDSLTAEGTTEIDGGRINTGTLDGDRIKAKTLTIDKLSTNLTGVNLVTDVCSFGAYANSGFAEGVPGRSGAAVNNPQNITELTDEVPGVASPVVVKHTSLNNSNYKYLHPTDPDSVKGWIKINAGKKYIISGYIRTDSTTDVTLSVIGTLKTYNASTIEDSWAASAAVNDSDGWVRVSVLTDVIPSNVSNPSFAVYIRTGTINKTGYFDAIQIEEWAGFGEEPSPFKEGGKTVIDGGSIVTGTISADRLAITGDIIVSGSPISSLNNDAEFIGADEVNENVTDLDITKTTAGVGRTKLTGDTIIIESWNGIDAFVTRVKLGKLN